MSKNNKCKRVQTYQCTEYNNARRCLFWNEHPGDPELWCKWDSCDGRDRCSNPRAQAHARKHGSVKVVAK